VIDASPERLLGRHVERRTDGHAFEAAFRTTEGARQAEVAELREAVLGQPDVLRLHVAVNDAVAVRVLESLEHLIGDAEHGLDRQTVLARAKQAAAERPSGHVLAHHIGDAVFLAAVVDRHDSRVVGEARDRAGLEIDARQSGRVESVGTDERDRDVAVEARVAREIDALVRALAEEAAHAITAGGNRRRRGGDGDGFRRRLRLGQREGGLEVGLHGTRQIELRIDPASQSFDHHHGDVRHRERRFEAQAVPAEDAVQRR